MSTTGDRRATEAPEQGAAAPDDAAVRSPPPQRPSTASSHDAQKQDRQGLASPSPVGLEPASGQSSDVTCSSPTMDGGSWPQRPAGISLSAVPSREHHNSPRKQPDAVSSASAKSADARLGDTPHEVHRRSSQHSLSIIERIRARDFNSAAAKLDPDSAEAKALTCAVCLDIYTSPKFLPCHHTFCASCIDDLAKRRPGKPFKCPSCRKEVILPPGGAQALQHNYYIKQEDLDKAARGIVDTSKCRFHLQQDLDMYCSDCDQVVCFKCVLTKHKEHNMQDLVDIAREAEERLEGHKARLKDIIDKVRQHVDRQKMEQQSLETKIAAIKQNLQDRHDTIVIAAKKFLEAAKESVEKVVEVVHDEVISDASFAQSYLTSLCRLQKNLDAAMKTKVKVDTVEADRDMRVGYGCQEALDELLSQKRTAVSRPVLRGWCNTGPVLASVRELFGRVEEMKLAVSDPEVDVVQKFRCGDAFDTEVFSICPKDNGSLSVSYERRGLDEHAPSEGFDDKGKRQYLRKEATGKSTWKSRGKGKGVFVEQLPGQRRTYCKGQDTEAFLRLDNNLTGVADVKRETIVSESPYKSKLNRECFIRCGPQRAFDADVSKTIFVVVEEAKAPETFRRVLLFEKGKEDSVAVFQPTVPACQPSDVCFCLLGKERVLLVADEMNDAIHVVDYQDGALTFLRFLVPGCPFLVQPTALNIDVHNKLWVACRGGGILMMVHNADSAVGQVPDA